MLSLSLWFEFISSLAHFNFDFLVLFLLHLLLFLSFGSSVLKHNIAALLLPPVGVSSLLFACLLFKQSLYQVFFVLGCIKSLLYLPLINQLLSISSFPLLGRELIVVFGFLDFVHRGCIREILNLSRRNAFLFLLPLNGFLNGDVLFDSLPGHVLLELINALVHIRGVLDHGPSQLVLVQLDLPVLEVELPFDLLGPDLPVVLPVLASVCLPVLHELLVLLQLPHGLLPLGLLDAHQHVCFRQVVLLGLLHQVCPRNFEFKQLLLDYLKLLRFECGTFDAMLFVNLWKSQRELSRSLDSLVDSLLLQICNGHIRLREVLVESQFNLVEQSERGASLFIHDHVDQLRIELHSDVPQNLLNLEEVCYFGFFALSIRFFIN